MCCLISICLCFLPFFFLIIDIKSHSIVVGEDAWYDFNFLTFTDVWLVTQDVICPGECSICTWEEGVFCIWNVLMISMRLISSNVLFKTCVSLLTFCFDDLSIGVSGVLKSPTIIVLLSISPFMSVSVCLRRGQWHPTPVLLPGKSHGRRNLVGCSPRGR